MLFKLILCALPWLLRIAGWRSAEFKGVWPSEILSSRFGPPTAVQVDISSSGTARFIHVQASMTPRQSR